RGRGGGGAGAAGGRGGRPPRGQQDPGRGRTGARAGEKVAPASPRAAPPLGSTVVAPVVSPDAAGYRRCRAARSMLTLSITSAASTSSDTVPSQSPQLPMSAWSPGKPTVRVAI